MEILKVISLTKIYNSYKGAKATEALGGINLTLNKGEFVGIMGPSGSGKTTLLNILSGLDKGTNGKVYINDVDINSLNKDELTLFRRRNIGYIFQDFNLLDSLTLEENVALPLILDKKEPQNIKNEVNSIMKKLNIIELKNKYPYNISGGQKQKIASARALINNPSIIYADEPTGNLDSKSSKTIMEFLKEMNGSMDSTILMVTHDPFAASFCRKIIFIKDGKIKTEIVSNGDRTEFFDKILEVQSVIGGEV